MLTAGGALTVEESIARLDNRIPVVDAAIDQKQLAGAIRGPNLAMIGLTGSLQHKMYATASRCVHR
jgi:hypothetical protein